MLAILLSLFLMQGAYLNSYQYALDLIERGRFGEAEMMLQETLDLHPDYLPALKRKAELQVNARHYQDAIDTYRRVLDLNPGDPYVLAHIAELYAWTGEYDHAIVTYRDAIKMYPDNLHVKIGLAKVMRWAQRYTEAAELYREVLGKDPENHHALKGLSKAYARMEDYADAARVIEKAIRLYPDDEELYKVKGNILAWQKNYHKAVEALRKAVDIAPDYVEAYATMGDVYQWMKSYKKSIISYKKAISISPDSDDYHLLLAEVYLKTYNTYLAVKQLNIALNINPLNTRAIELLDEIEGRKWYMFIQATSHLTEFVIYSFVLVLIFINFRKKGRLLARKHRIYLVFVNFIIPVSAVISLVLYMGQNIISDRFDVDAEFLHSISESFLFFVFGMSFLSFLVEESRKDLQGKDVVLAIGAHPDDIELGCSGYLMKAKDRGARIYGLVMTKGEMGTNNLENREVEQLKAARFMGMDGIWVLDFRDTRLGENILGLKDAIQEKIIETGATVVLTHTANDIHSDHRAVFKATREAARKTAEVLSYEDVSTPDNFRANYYADISKYIDDKTKLLSFHKTQAHRAYMDPDVVKGRAAHRGLQSNLQYAEAFKIYRFIQ